jgi:hypothetical protein
MKLLDVVALTFRRNACYVGRLVFEVEFADINGRTYALIALPKTRLMVLHHQPADRAA